MITGATGFIGQRLVDLLLSAGNSVNYLARKQDRDMDSRAAFFEWDARSEPPLDCMGRLDAIVHLAGEPVAQRWNAEVKQRIRDSRVFGTRALVSAVGKLKYKPSVLVSASAIGYYGTRGDARLTESASPGSGFLAEVCASWEREALRAAEYRVRVVTPRISVVLGNGGGALPQMAKSFRFGLGGTLGDGRQWMSWIQVDDMAALLRFAVENPNASGALNAASPHPVTNQEFTKTLAHTMHRPALFRIPRFALRLAMGEMGDHAMDSARVIPEAAQSLGFQFRYPDLESALRASLA